MPYSQASDLYAFGLPRGSTPNPGRTLASAEDSVCVLNVHGFSDDDPILFQPAGDGELPAGLSANVTYYAQAVTEHAFRVRDTAGGSAITFSDADDPLLVLSPLPVAAAIAWADAIIDDMLPAHVVPITGTVPEIVRMTSAELAAGKLLAVMGAASASLSDTVDRATKRLERWAKGIPLRGPDAPAPAGLASAATVPYVDRRGWGRFGGL